MVDDVDAHHAHAHQAGARIVAESQDGCGQRRYRLLDPEGHMWPISSALE